MMMMKIVVAVVSIFFRRVLIRIDVDIRTRGSDDANSGRDDGGWTTDAVIVGFLIFMMMVMVIVMLLFVILVLFQ